jgi:hypothetical protein
MYVPSETLQVSRSMVVNSPSSKAKQQEAGNGTKSPDSSSSKTYELVKTKNEDGDLEEGSRI